MLHQKLSFNFIETQFDNNPLMETFMCPPIIHLLDETETNIQNYHACEIDSGGAHYLSRKHDNFDIGCGRVQISV